MYTKQVECHGQECEVAEMQGRLQVRVMMIKGLSLLSV